MNLLNHTNHNMTVSQRKQFIMSVIQQWTIKDMLDILALLLILMKKFGKQISQSPVREFVEKNYPDAYSLYMLLWSVHVTTKDCLLLQQKLYEALWEDHLLALSSDTSALKWIEDNSLLIDGGDSSNPSLTIKSPSRVYKRSLMADLQKML